MLHRLVIVVLVMAGWILPEFEIVTGAEFKLGSRFQDTDSDMVADTPSDPAKQVDPSTLIFAYTPVEDPAVYAKLWKGFLEHMEKVSPYSQMISVRLRLNEDCVTWVEHLGASAASLTLQNTSI